MSLWLTGLTARRPASSCVRPQGALGGEVRDADGSLLATCLG